MEAAPSFPAPLRYLFEREQGRSPALNCGIRAAAGDIIVTTDDDVRVPADWLNRAAEGLERLGCDYVGGRVLPIWGGPRPAWLPDRGGKQWAVIALLDYGPEPIEFGTRVPLGVNMAFRRSAFERAGGFDPHTGRAAGTLLGQEVREWCIRARKAGVRGFYVPEMSAAAHHPRRSAEQAVLPALVLLARHQPRAALRAVRPRHGGAGADHARLLDACRTSSGCRAICTARRCARAATWIARLAARRDASDAFEHELWLCFFAGIVRQRFRDSRARRAPGCAGRAGGVMATAPAPTARSIRVCRRIAAGPARRSSTRPS